MLKVFLIDHTPNPEKIITLAAKTCYSKLDISDINIGGEEEVSKFVQMLFDMDHLSPFEHISFIFGIEGISRACSHQLVRHRIGCSFSQKSQRYAPISLNAKGPNRFRFIIPESIKNSEYLIDYLELMERIQNFYNYMKDIPDEDRRYIFPNACETQIVVTMNARELLHFFNVRCCNRAQWEIREMANQMLNIVKNIAPNIFEFAGPNCVKLGYCPEGKMTCGQSFKKINEKIKETKKEKKIVNVSIDTEYRDECLEKLKKLKEEHKPTNEWDDQ